MERERKSDSVRAVRMGKVRGNLVIEVKSERS